MKVISTVFREEPSDYLYPISQRGFLRVLSIGFGAGLITWLLALALDRFMLTPMFCGSEATNVSVCANSTAIGSYVASVLVGIMTVPALAINGVRRPLLVAAAAIASLWGVAVWTGGSWVWSLVLTVAAFAAVYVAASWLNRIRGNVAAIVFLIVFVILARVVLSL